MENDDLVKEIKRLRKFEEVVKFIATDYIELSFAKAEWQRNDWRRRCYNTLNQNSDQFTIKDLDDKF